MKEDTGAEVGVGRENLSITVWDLTLEKREGQGRRPEEEESRTAAQF